MLMLIAGIEILVGISSQIAKSFHLILHGVGVNDVHDDSNAVLMGGVDESLQFLRSSETAGGGKEGTHMIAK